MGSNTTRANQWGLAFVPHYAPFPANSRVSPYQRTRFKQLRCLRIWSRICCSRITAPDPRWHRHPRRCDPTRWIRRDNIFYYLQGILRCPSGTRTWPSRSGLLWKAAEAGNIEGEKLGREMGDGQGTSWTSEPLPCQREPLPTFFL